MKEASVYIKPSALNVTKDEPVEIEVNARLKTKTIDHIDFYVRNQLLCTLTEAPYVVSYVPTITGKHSLKAVVVATDSTEYERMGSFTANKPRTPYKGGTTLPGTLQAENFDSGSEGQTYHDSDTKNEGTSSYRTDGGGVDMVTGNGGYAIGYTAAGEWLEYTVDVTEAGKYSYEAVVSSGNTGSAFTLALKDGNSLVDLCKVNVPKTCDDWNTYTSVKGNLSQPLEAGTHILRITINGSYCNIDKIIFTCTEPAGIDAVSANGQTGRDAVYNLSGQQVAPGYKGIVVKNGRKMLMR